VSWQITPRALISAVAAGGAEGRRAFTGWACAEIENFEIDRFLDYISEATDIIKESTK
jgi:CRISPR/Cas system endoribonuclease Cas6 (RAMP superfamily)